MGKNDPMEHARYAAALYMRLSRDDEGAKESASITNQRLILTTYAKENDFHIYGEYVDDGISGTTFERPQFKRMLRDIEDKKVNMVITKDLSRLGRDYILTGQYTEIYFPSKKVRYIAVNDGYDSDSPYTDIAPFKNVINEMYARDTSRKIRSALEAKMREGAFVGAFAPYGYQRDKADRHHLVIDELPAQIIQEIFWKTTEGISPGVIAKELNARKIAAPMEYRLTKHLKTAEGMNQTGSGWTAATITKMLHNIVYMGHMAQGKTAKISFKSTVTVQNPKEDWFVSENTHEPLIGSETFALAQKRCRQRTHRKKGEFCNVFAQIAQCADCGRKMSSVGTRKKGATANLTCSGYKRYGAGTCTNHFIDYDVLYAIVLSSLQKQIKLTEQDRAEIIGEVFLRAGRQFTGNQGREDQKKQKVELRRRSRELDLVMKRIYEDYARGVLEEARMTKLMGQYESESRSISELLVQITNSEDTDRNEIFDRLRARLDSLAEIKQLTPKLLLCLVDRIEISQGREEAAKKGRVKYQDVTIWFRFLGADSTETYILQME